MHVGNTCFHMMYRHNFCHRLPVYDSHVMLNSVKAGIVSHTLCNCMCNDGKNDTYLHGSNIVVRNFLSPFDGSWITSYATVSRCFVGL